MNEVIGFSAWVSFTVLLTMATITSLTLCALGESTKKIDVAITLVLICLTVINWYYIFTSTINFN